MNHDPTRDPGTTRGPEPPRDGPAGTPDYAPPRRRRLPPAARFVGGAFSSTALLLIIATALPFTAGITIAIVAGFAAVVFLLFIAIRLDRAAASQALTSGVLTGIAVALLIYGACMAWVARSFQH